MNNSGSDYIFINYTIDNYIAITGKKDNMTFNKAGYLLDRNTTAKIVGSESIIPSASLLSKFKDLDANSGTDKQIDELIDEIRKVPGTKITINVQNEQIIRIIHKKI